MRSYLLTWNPRGGEEEWPDVAECLEASRAGRHVLLTWRCHNKSPLPGDRVFLLRQGVEPRGIMGSGDVLSAPYRREPEGARIVNVRMDVLLDPVRERVLPLRELQDGVLAEVHWGTQRSGIAIPDGAAHELLKRWPAFVKDCGRTIVTWYSAEQYARVLRHVAPDMNEPQRRMLMAHVQAPGHCLSIMELAAAAGHDTPHIVHSQYGQLGKRLGEALDHTFEPGEISTRIVADDHRTESGDLCWTLDVALARALNREEIRPILYPAGAGARVGAAFGASTLFPDEIAETEHLIEGAKQTVVVNRYERNPVAKRLCIEHYGARCVVCGLSFEERYGASMAGFIHVHHLTPLAEIGEAYRVDPIKDLRPICPNCHAVAHSRSPALSIEEAKGLIADAG